MCLRPEIVVMIALGREKMMQHMLLGVHEVTEQCVVVVLESCASVTRTILPPAHKFNNSARDKLTSAVGSMSIFLVFFAKFVQCMRINCYC